MKNKSILCWIVAFAMMMGAGLHTLQAQSLSDVIKENNGDWLIGNWEATDNDGNTHTQTFKWELGKNVVVSHNKNPRWEIMGMTAYNADTEEVTYVGYSNRGGRVTGTWNDREGSPILRVKAQGSDGQSWEGAVLYKKIDDKTMRIEMFRVDDNGDVEDEARGGMEFKRKK